MELISILELVGTVAFAVSGALLAIDKELDYYGIAFLAIITAVGGGIFRDVLINDNLPAALDNPLFAIISILSAAATVLFYRKIIKYSKKEKSDTIYLMKYVIITIIYSGKCHSYVVTIGCLDPWKKIIG